MPNPLVSVCIPTYHRPAFLRDTVQTILSQDYAPFDVLISDNGADEETTSFCEALVRSDSRVRYVRHPRNIGMHANHNFCIEQSRGEFLCFFHDDDLYAPQILSTYVAFLKAHPEAGIVCSDWELINGAGERIGLRTARAERVTPGLVYLDRTIRSGRSSIGCPGALIRRSALGSIRFDEQGPPGFGDFVVWFQIAERWAVGHLTQRLWRYRLHGRNVSCRTIESIVRDYDQVLIAYCDGHLARWPAHGRLVARWRRAIRQYLFWALAYELGLHFRQGDAQSVAPSSARTVFEVVAYRLTPEQLHDAQRQLRTYRTGVVQTAALVAMHGLIDLHLTQPLAWATRHAALVRGLLGLR